jgi:hypothetical protein
MDFARRAAAGADADDIYGMRIPSPDGNGNLELVLCLRLRGWNLEPADYSCSQKKGDLNLSVRHYFHSSLLFLDRVVRKNSSSCLGPKPILII